MTGQINYLAAQARFQPRGIRVLVNPADERRPRRLTRASRSPRRLFHRLPQPAAA
jgi:hypothetical protein